jgi:two-component system cell cycle response regulator DivK
MNSKILIIDDDPRNIFALAATLKARGFQCLSSLSAKEGMALLNDDQDIKIVLLDMMMPDMDGYEALGVIRAEAALASVPVIAVTAQAMVGDREKCLAAGADNYISKPVDVDRLLAMIVPHFTA